MSSPRRSRAVVDAVVARVAAGDPWLAGAMLALVLYYVSTRGVFQGKASGDGWFELQYLRALVTQGTLDMSGVFGNYGRAFGHQGPLGWMPNRWPIGPPLFWLPFYLVALAVYATAHAIAPSQVPNIVAAEPLFAWFSGLGTLAAVLWGWRALYVLLRRNMGVGAARFAAIAAVWCTPLPWYAVTQPLYQHGVAFAVVAVTIEYWDRTYGRSDGARWAWLGFLGGLAALMRPQEVLYLLPAGVELLQTLFRAGASAAIRRAALRNGLIVVAVFVVTFAPQLALWWAYSGALHPAQQEPLRWTEPFIGTVLFSTRAGLFPWTPLTYLACIGLCFARRPGSDQRRLAIGLLVVFVVELYVVASAWTPTAGYCYGTRRLTDGALLLGVGAALLYRRVELCTSARRLVLALGGLFLFLNVAGMELQRNHWIASSGAYPRTPGKMLEEAHLPRALADFADHFGLPFVQPVGWLWDLRYHAHPSTFDGVFGGTVLERDPQHPEGVILSQLVFDRVHAANAVDGLAVADQGPGRVTGPVRLLFDLFAAEPLRVDLEGRFPPLPSVPVQWNSCAISAQGMGNIFRMEVPARCVRAGTNEVKVTLPIGAELRRVAFTSTSDWYLSFFPKNYPKFY